MSFAVLKLEAQNITCRCDTYTTGACGSFFTLSPFDVPLDPLICPDVPLMVQFGSVCAHTDCVGGSMKPSK